VINIQPFVLLLYTTVNINVNMQLHDLQCTSTVHQKVSHMEFSTNLQAGQDKVQLKSEK